MNSSKGYSFCLIIICVIVIMSSCSSPRELQYMQGQFDTAQLSRALYPTPVIQKNDLINITVFSDDPKASAYFNLPSLQTVANTGATSAPTAGGSNVGSNGSTYLVDEEGQIQMPGIGKIMVAGLTKKQVDSVVISKVKDKLQNPYTIIRMESYKVTMLGEVTKPGQFTIPNERVSLWEAIALAGDLTPYGRRDNVLIIREINGERTFQRIDLKSPDIMKSSYFYLQPNDVVIVDLNKTKASVNDQVLIRNISLAMGIISLLVVIVTLARTTK